MAWNDKLSVGVAKIDEDHKRLVCLINELYDGIIAGRSDELLGGILDELVAYTQYHFAREEKYCEKIRYISTDAHKKEHHSMILWVTDVQNRYRNQTLVAPSLEVMNYLKDWLFDHIIRSDKDLGDRLNALGVQ